MGKLAKEQGATHLDAFVSNKQNLESIYKKTLGARTASRMDFNPDYDESGIGDRHGNPDVVFMVFGDAATSVEEKHFGKDDYDTAQAHQRSFLPKKKNASQTVYDNLEKQRLRSINPNNPGSYLIHQIPYSMYGMVSSVPEHGVDKTITVGTQLQKIIAEDIPDDAKFSFNGKVLTKKEMLDVYNSVYTEKIMRAYRNVTGKFADRHKLSESLQRAVKSSSRGSDTLMRAFSLDENGNFIIPLCDLSTINLSSEFLNSIIRKAVTKATVPGGQFVQMSCFGMSDDLNLEFEYDEEGNPIALKAIECYLPAYTRSIIEQFSDKNGYVPGRELALAECDCVK